MSFKQMLQRFLRIMYLLALAVLSMILGIGGYKYYLIKTGPQHRPIEFFIDDAMKNCGKIPQGAAREVLISQIARIAKDVLPLREQQESFVLLICIESGFKSLQKSGKGAIGLTQVMPKYANEFASTCGLGQVDEKALMDNELNLRIGACQYRELIIQFEGNEALAFAAYNSGAFSETVKGLPRLQTGNAETMGYLGKALYLKEKVK